MKIGLKICSVLVVLPLLTGAQKHHSDSLYTDLSIGAGGGSYGNTFYIRNYVPGYGTGCDGSGSGGFNLLLGKLILLDFFHYNVINILSIKYKIESLTDIELRKVILLRGHSLFNHLTPPTKGLLSFQGGDQKGR